MSKFTSWGNNFLGQSKIYRYGAFSEGESVTLTQELVSWPIVCSSSRLLAHCLQLLIHSLAPNCSLCTTHNTRDRATNVFTTY